MNVVVEGEGTLVFTEKQAKVVRMLADDNTVTGIASKLNLNVRGLEGTMAILRRKTGCRTIGGIVAFFYRNKLID